MLTDRVGRAVVVTLGSLTAVVGTFLTWVRSGATSRSSYDVFGLVERLGFSPDGSVGIALRLWPLVPLGLAVTVVAHWFELARTQRAVLARTVLAGFVTAYAGATALAVTFAPEIALFELGVGPIVTLVGAVVVLAAVAGGLITDARRR